MGMETVTRTEPFRIRIKPDLKRRLDEMFARKRISQQEGGEALLTWLLAQDDVVQSVVMGQIAAKAELFKLIEWRMLAPKQGQGKVHAHRGLEK